MGAPLNLKFEITRFSREGIAMHSKSRLALMKKLLAQQDSEGFSLVELVVVIAVLSVLSAVAIPSFLCVTTKARATAALSAMKQIQKECIA